MLNDISLQGFPELIIRVDGVLVEPTPSGFGEARIDRWFQQAVWAYRHYTANFLCSSRVVLVSWLPGDQTRHLLNANNISLADIPVIYRGKNQKENAQTLHQRLEKNGLRLRQRVTLMCHSPHQGESDELLAQITRRALAGQIWQVVCPGSRIGTGPRPAEKMFAVGGALGRQFYDAVRDVLPEQPSYLRSLLPPRPL